MHEFSIAAAIADQVLTMAAARQVEQVVAVHLAVGALTMVDPEQLRFCYQSITQDTPLADSLLEIEPLPALVRCPHCHYHGPPQLWEDALMSAPVPTLECPTCGRLTEAEQGHECVIKTIRAMGGVAA